MSMWRRVAARAFSSSARSLVGSPAPRVLAAPTPPLACLPYDPFSAPAAAAARLVPFQPKVSPLRPFSSVPAGVATSNKELQAEIEHATGLEKEELIGEAEGKPRFDLAPPRGPFGTTEAPALIESYFDERIVGCSGDEGDDEHDVVWFKLKKDVGHTCSVCGQVFQLKVVGEGGVPGGHH